MTILSTVSKNISAPSALQIINSALQTAKEKSYTISVTVVDTSGNIIAQAKGDGAPHVTLSGSYNKAFTANSLQMNSSAIVELIKNTPSIKAFKRFDSRIVYMGGGVPIIIDGVCIGAVGISGVPDPLEDEAVALLAINSIK